MFQSILPNDVQSSRGALPDGSPVFYLRHSELGDLGRIVVRDTPGGLANIITEIAGDDTDPMAARRRRIFEPIATALNKELERLLGAVETNMSVAEPLPSGQSHMVPSKLMQCSGCDDFYAHLIFVDHPATQGDLEDVARMMFPNIKEANLPTWIIGASMEDGVPEHAESMVLKVWPDRQDMQFMTPDEFNKVLAKLERQHCPGAG